MAGAVACAAMLTIACAGDARDSRDDDDDRSATTATAGDSDRYRDADGDRAHLDSDDDLQARTGSRDDRVDISTPGSVGTSGQAQGPQAHGPDNAHDFMRKAAMTGHAEVQLGQLAAERAQSPDVKQFAQMMVRDHTKANNELKQAVTGAAGQSVELAPALDQKHQHVMDRLRTLRGAEFDREYMKAMVEGHTEAKSMLETRAHTLSTRTGPSREGQSARTEPGQSGRTDRSATTGTSGVATGGSQLENSISQWANKTLPTVEQHLQRAQQISAKLGSSAAGTTKGGANSR